MVKISVKFDNFFFKLPKKKGSNLDGKWVKSAQNKLKTGQLLVKNQLSWEKNSDSNNRDSVFFVLSNKKKIKNLGQIWSKNMVKNWQNKNGQKTVNSLSKF